MPIESLAVIRILLAYALAGVGEGIGRTLEVHYTHVVLECHRGERALVSHEIDYTGESAYTDEIRVGIDVDALDQQRVVRKYLLMVKDGYSVQQDECSAARETIVAARVGRQDLDFAASIRLSGADFGNKLDEQFFHHREPGVVIKDVALPGFSVESGILLYRDRRIQRVCVECPFQLHSQPPEFERFPVIAAKCE